MNVLKMAARNLGRNRRRTAVTTVAMSFATIVTIWYTALAFGMLNGLEKNVLGMQTADVQIHHEEYLEDANLYDRLDPEPLLGKLDEQGYAATPRLYGFALAAAGTSSSGIELRGIDIEREARVTRIHTAVARGQWLSRADPHGVVIGKKLAATLSVDVGDEIVVVGQASDGSMANELYQVRGILKNVGAAVDTAGFLMVEDSFRELMVVPDGTHEIAVARQYPTQPLPEIAADVERAVEQTRADKGVVRTWKELEPILANLLATTDASLYAMMILIYFAIALVVFNAMLMSVFERIREFGVLKAVGVRPRQIFGMLVAEAVLQAAVAAAVSLPIAVPLSLFMETHGIDLSNFAGDLSLAGVAYDPILYTLLTPDAVWAPLFFMTLLTVLAVAYPAGKAALIRPVDAFRHQ